MDDHLPEDYVARKEDLVHVIRSLDERSSTIRPDISLTQNPRFYRYPMPGHGVATLEPMTVPLETSDLEEVRELWIEIRRLHELALVTVVELLSPSNKIGDGRREYPDKRRSLIEQSVHLVELDLLLGGRRLPLRHGLPTIPIPLYVPDPDIPLDLAPEDRGWVEGLVGRPA